MSQAILGTLRGADEVDMGDLEFIQGKVTAGDYFQVSGDINALNDTIEFIVPNLKTAFMIEAKITMSTNPFIAITSGVGATQNTNDQIVADLLIDTVVKSKAKIGVGISAQQGQGTGGTNVSNVNASNDGKFNVLGLSLVGDGVKLIEIENVLDSGSGFAEMSGYLIDT